MNECSDFNIEANLKDTYKRYCDGNISRLDFIDYISRLIRNFNIVDVLYYIYLVVPFNTSVDIFSSIKFSNRKREIKSIAVCIDQCCLGGRARVNSILVDMWIKLGYHVVVFSDEARPSDFKCSESVKRIVFPMPHKDVRGRLSFLKKHCEEEKIDILISHNWLTSNNLYDVVMLKSLGIYCLIYAHGVFSNIMQWSDPLDFTNLFKCYDLVLCLSQADYYFYTKNNVNAYLIDNPISDDLKKNRITSNLKNNVVSIIGRIDNDKLPLDSLKIFKKLHDARPDIRFNIVGRGNDVCVGQIQRYVKDNNLTDCVSIHSDIPPNKIYDFYIKSDCILLTSPSEGYPMVLLEACCFGVPVCMYELSYLALTKNNKGILSSRCNDIDGLSNKLIKLMSDDNNRIEIGKAARLFFLKLSKRDVEKTWINIFKNIANGHVLEGKKEINEKSKDGSLAMSLLLEATRNLYYRYAKAAYSKDYKVGRMLCFFPRKIVHFFKRLLHHKK